MAASPRKRLALSGRTFKSFFNIQLKKSPTDNNEVNSSERKCIAKETLVNAEKIIVDGTREEELQTFKMEASDLIRESQDVGIDIKCGDSATSCKRKRDLSMDLQAPSGCKTSIACEGKSSSSKFEEFWVPSIISNVQLEQYCDTLLSNSISLRSHSKTDPVGALRDIVFSTRKSCDHPYIVNPFLKHLITKDLPPTSFLDVEIKASGKLQLLEIILSEIKKRQLRVLILFQSVAGSGRDKLGLGDILDDFLSERFGADTYERVDGGAFPSKSRQTALNNFNKGCGRFMFLLENRACLPSIKLVSVDTIIIFDSDWNPANDVKALNKISIDSQFKQIKIFRLYSAFTVEEKVLILAKQGLTLESNLEGISRATSNTLLMWGASCLLSRLDEFHSTPDTNVSSEQELSSKVVDEILALLPENGECDDIDNYSIFKVQQRGGIYSSSLKLLGEQQVQLSDDEHPQFFWTNLLNRRILKWKFLSGKTQRQRKKVQYFDDLPKNAECGAVEVGKKRKNGEAHCSNPTILNSVLEPDKTGGAPGLQGEYGLCCSERPDASAPNLLYTSVKPDILKLCEILKLSDEVKIMVERFLEYVISKHQVKSGSASILQAFLISMCWGSASLLKQKVNRKESVFLARTHLKFSCSEIEADHVYSAVRKLKKTFKDDMLSDLSDDSISGVKKLRENNLQLQTVKPELEEIRDQAHTDETAQDDERHKVNIEFNFELIQSKCKKRIAKLEREQEEEIEKLKKSWEDQRVDIENKQKVESAIIREMYNQIEPLRTDKLKRLDNECRMKVVELERQKEISLEQLKAKQLDALSNERSKVAQWLKSATSFAIEVAGQDELALHQSDIQNKVGYSQASEPASLNVSENDATLSRHPDDFASDTDIVKMVPGNACATDPNQDVRCNRLDETVNITENPNCKDDELENMSSKNVPVAGSQQPNGLGSPANGYENAVSLSLHHSENQNPDKSMSSGPGEMILPETLEKIPEKVTGQDVEENPPKDDRERHLSDKQPEIPQQMVEHTEELPNQVLHLRSIVEVHPPTDVIETPLQQNPDNSMSSGPGEMILPETPERIPEKVTGQDVEENPPKDDRERHLADKQPEIPQQIVEHTEELSNQVLHLRSIVEVHPPTDVIETPLQQNQPDLLSTSTLDHQPLILNTSFLNSEAVPQVTERTTELPKQAIIPTGVDMSVVQGFQDLPLCAEHQVPSRIPKLTSYSDPLQNELERIRKETEQAIKLLEDAKMRLKCELDEVIAQLHRKYEDKCKDLEVVFQRKKNELDKNYNKVLMNEILADAFRSKCVEPSRYSGMQRGGQLAVKQQRTTLLMQPGPGNNFVSDSSSADQPAASQQSTTPLLQPSPRVSPIIVSSSAVQPVASQSTPPLQIVHQSAALFSSTPTRPPQINPITPSMGNLRVGHENRARAPAPHIQAFRSASPVNLASTQRVIPSHLTRSSLPTSSPHSLMVHHVQPQQNNPNEN